MPRLVRPLEAGSRRADGAPQESGGPQGASNDDLNFAIMAMNAGSLEQPVENKGRLGDPASLTGYVTLKK